jgi:hypothetical protein
VSLAAIAVGVTVSVAAEIALLTVIVAAALAAERIRGEGGEAARGQAGPAPDTVEA